jgi:hypothetical protein
MFDSRRSSLTAGERPNNSLSPQAPGEGKQKPITVLKQ